MQCTSHFMPMGTAGRHVMTKKARAEKYHQIRSSLGMTLEISPSFFQQLRVTGAAYSNA